ncbi:MAG: polymer-forming cytoskeletal protein, partial [Oscillospiraceae bacterium]|nr:polymer-forming cytoskeletal protein [Oscillospiraceae bacterium]
RAEGDVEVLGKLKGNLEATGNIRVVGKVLGDVKGEAVILEGCTVQGNITSTSGLLLDESAMVIGDVLASDLDAKGKIKGNLQIARAASFGPTALLAGNVIAATIVMAQGARVQGTVRIAEDPETNGLFGELEI